MAIKQFLNRDNVYYYEDNYDQAMVWYQRWVREIEQNNSSDNDLDDLAKNYRRLGLLNKQMKRYQDAVSWFEKSLTLFKKIDEREAVADCLCDIGSAYSNISDYNTALDFYNQSLQQYSMLNKPSGIGRCYHDIGLIYHKQKNYGLAIDYYNQSIKVKELFNNHENIPITCNNLANIYRTLRNYEEAIAWYNCGLAQLQETPDSKAEQLIQSNLGKLYSNHIKQPERAYTHLKRAVELLDDIRGQFKVDESQMDFLSGKESDYIALIRTCISINRVEEAFIYTERAKSRTLIDMLSNARIKLNYSDRQILRRKVAIEGRIASLERQITYSAASDRQLHVQLQINGGAFLSSIRKRLPKLPLLLTPEERKARLVKAEEELAQINKEIKSSAREWSSMVAVPAADFDTIYNRVHLGVSGTDERPLLISYFQIGQEVLAFLLPIYDGPPKLTMCRLSFFQSAEQREWIESFHHTMQTLMHEIVEDLTILHNSLIEPILGEIQKWPVDYRPSLLQFAPHSLLHTLPLHAAYDQSNDCYLFEKYPVAYTPAISLLHFWQTPDKRARRGRDGSALVYGNPTGDLSHSEEEARAVAELLGTSPYCSEPIKLPSWYDRISVRRSYENANLQCRTNTQDPGASRQM